MHACLLSRFCLGLNNHFYEHFELLLIWDQPLVGKHALWCSLLWMAAISGSFPILHINSRHWVFVRPDGESKNYCSETTRQTICTEIYRFSILTLGQVRAEHATCNIHVGLVDYSKAISLLAFVTSVCEKSPNAELLQ